MNAVGGAPAQVLHRGPMHGEVDGDIRLHGKKVTRVCPDRGQTVGGDHRTGELGETAAGVMRIDASNECEPVRTGHGSAHLGAHATTGPKDRDSRQCSRSGFGVLTHERRFCQAKPAGQAEFG